MLEFINNSISIFFSGPIKMYPVFIILIVGFFIQSLKIIIDVFRYKQFNRDQLFLSGGFPSFHSGLATSATMITFFESGIDSTLFAIVFAFSILFSYDAMNLRYETGQHAHYINNLRMVFQNILVKNEKGLLKERIGHTPFEVLGGIFFGFLLTFLLYYFFVLG